MTIREQTSIVVPYQDFKIIKEVVKISIDNKEKIPIYVPDSHKKVYSQLLDIGNATEHQEQSTGIGYSTQIAFGFSELVVVETIMREYQEHLQLKGETIPPRHIKINEELSTIKRAGRPLKTSHMINRL